MKCLTYKQKAEWNDCVKSFPDWDVYYLCEYAESLMLHGDGEPILLCYEDAHVRMCYVVMKNDVASCPHFENQLPYGLYFDFETPYGYGGPLIDGDFSSHSQRQFIVQLQAFCEQTGVVSQFIRFNPLLDNQAHFTEVSDNVYLKDTVYIDTSSERNISANMDSTNRNKIRKAQNAGIQIIKAPIGDDSAFLEMYRETMQQRHADHYYYFSEPYFEFLQTALEDNVAIFYAMLDSKPVGGAVFLYTGKTMHYHLAGMHAAYRPLAAATLLIYEAAIWANHQGISRLHLGGGLKAEDDLFTFKKQFNRAGRLPFYIGRTIFIPSAYDYLLGIRQQLRPDFSRDNDFMIQYRG